MSLSRYKKDQIVWITWCRINILLITHKWLEWLTRVNIFIYKPCIDIGLSSHKYLYKMLWIMKKKMYEKWIKKRSFYNMEASIFVCVFFSISSFNQLCLLFPVLTSCVYRSTAVWSKCIRLWKLQSTRVTRALDWSKAIILNQHQALNWFEWYHTTEAWGIYQ